MVFPIVGLLLIALAIPLIVQGKGRVIATRSDSPRAKTTLAAAIAIETLGFLFLVFGIGMVLRRKSQKDWNLP